MGLKNLFAWNADAETKAGASLAEDGSERAQRPFGRRAPRVCINQNP